MGRGRTPLLLGGALGVALAQSAQAAAESDLFAVHLDLLGAPANILVYAPTRDIAQAATAAAVAQVDRLNLILSGQREDSELAALNRSPVMAVSPELFAVLYQAEAMRVQTRGAFDARLGAVERLWSEANGGPPDRAALECAAAAARAPVLMDASSRRVTRSPGVRFALDAIAKGYIIDQALAAARRAAPLASVMIDIGGDMRCESALGSDRSWTVGLPDPAQPHLDAPLVDRVCLRDQAIATSGRGPRDRIFGGERFSPTLRADTGWSVQENLAATVIAPTAARADALATALLVMPVEDGRALVDRLHDVHARITRPNGEVHLSRNWAGSAADGGLVRVANPPARPRTTPARPASPPPVAVKPGPLAPRQAAPAGWPVDWAMQFVYEAPERNEAKRASDFRTPYMVMWISDKQNRPIRTLALVGKDPQYQRENYIWWNVYGARARRLGELRSNATLISGRYPVIWPGYNDDFVFLPGGEYILHIETSRERGQHTHRAIPLVLGTTAFERIVPPTEEGGGMRITYGPRS